jgi:hypothetical protein
MVDWQNTRRLDRMPAGCQATGTSQAIASVGRTARIVVTAPAYGVGGSLQERQTGWQRRGHQWPANHRDVARIYIFRHNLPKGSTYTVAGTSLAATAVIESIGFDNFKQAR